MFLSAFFLENEISNPVSTAMFIASSFEHYKKNFVDQLQVMLASDKPGSDNLGCFILALANSLQDKDIRVALHADLEITFDMLKKSFDDYRSATPPDDVAVFEQLREIDLSDLPLWKSRRAGRWDITCNTIRKLRPARASSQVLCSIKKDFDASGFHFNKPFLKPEILWQGEFRNVQLRVLYNKFPFADYHLLITVSPEQERAQLIDEAAHQLIHDLVQQNAEKLPGFGAGFNSLAAGASVNHLHFQGFIRQQALPIEDTCWLHNGGKDKYPLVVYRFDAAGSAWNRIEQLIELDIAFNCLYRAGVCYVIPRKYQGSVELPDWLQGAGWLDVAGVMTVSDDEMLDSISEKEISQSLNLL